MPFYTKNFYKQHRERVRRSAREIVPLVLNLIQPKHVIDVGCGTGTWLSVFRECGVEEVFGVDGEWIDEAMLEIPQERFFSFDLTQPLRLDRQFDLVLALEVAEHLPSACAATFIDSLTRLGSVILFSAAIPNQEGTHHINEQWPGYWEQYFRARGYVLIDCLREKIGQNDNVEWIYPQNVLMFIGEGYIDNHAPLKKEFERTTSSRLAIVHPRQYLQTIELMRSLHLTAQDIAALIPPGAFFILVDNAYIFALQEQFGVEVATGRHAIPFLERDGQYWGRRKMILPRSRSSSGCIAPEPGSASSDGRLSGSWHTTLSCTATCARSSTAFSRTTVWSYLICGRDVEESPCVADCAQ